MVARPGQAGHSHGIIGDRSGWKQITKVSLLQMASERVRHLGLGDSAVRRRLSGNLLKVQGRGASRPAFPLQKAQRKEPCQGPWQPCQTGVRSEPTEAWVREASSSAGSRNASKNSVVGCRTRWTTCPCLSSPGAPRVAGSVDFERPPLSIREVNRGPDAGRSPSQFLTSLSVSGVQEHKFVIQIRR